MPKGIRGSKAPHGTRARYGDHGCRCDECRAAYTAYIRGRTGARTKADYLAEVTKEHGASAYRKGRCRCDVCRAISAATKRRYLESHPDYRARQNAERLRKYHAA